MPESTTAVLERIERDKDRYLEELMAYLRIPSVSTDPAHREDVRRCSEFLAERMREAGLEVERIETSGHPLVYGEWTKAEGRPTLLFYGHYDVQPPDPLELWRHPPFEPTLEGDRIVARGATDDKGQSYTHLKAVEATLAERGELPVNVKFLVEGEEEAGGEAIDRYIRQDGGDRLACDAVIISDTSMFGSGQPSLLYGLRGLAYFEITVQGPNRDLHSGTYGGGVANPANVLCQVIASLRDPATGRILVPGFYDDVRELEAWEREEFARLPLDEKAYQADLGVPELFGEAGYSILERAWTRPSCDVNGLTAGYQGEGAKTVIPASARAKVSTRLVPDQDPQRIAGLVAAHVARVAPRGAKTAVRFVHGAKPVLIDPQGPLVDAALEALEEIWGAKPVRVREGGSIPVVSTFSEILEVPVLLMGFGLNDDRLHSPNEKFDLDHFYNGIRTIARLLDRVGAVEEVPKAARAR